MIEKPPECDRRAADDSGAAMSKTVPAGYQPIPLREVEQWWKDMERLAQLGKKTSIEFEAGFLSGLMEGTRRERRALRRWMMDLPIEQVHPEQLLRWLDARSKAKRP